MSSTSTPFHSPSPTPTTTPRQRNVTLPKASKQDTTLFLEIAVEKNSIDSQNTFALTNLLKDREFILEFKRRQAATLAAEKEERVTRGAARLNKMAPPKQELSSNGITPISKCDGADFPYDAYDMSSSTSLVSGCFSISWFRKLRDACRIHVHVS